MNTLFLMLFLVSMIAVPVILVLLVIKLVKKQPVKKIAPHNYATSNATKEELVAQGYEPCGICKP